MPEAKKAFVVNYALVTSSVALLVSLTSFYFTWLHEEHSLRLGVLSTSCDEDHYPVTFSSGIVLLNGGNRVAVVLSLALSIESRSLRTSTTKWVSSPRLRRHRILSIF